MNLFKMIFRGISWGATIFTFIMIGIAAAGGETFSMSSTLFIKHAIGCLIVGMGFTIPSLIYEKKNLSIKIQTLIHMSCGFLIYLPVAYYLGWLPVSLGWQVILFTLACAIITAFAIWYGYYLYYKWEAKRINQKLGKLN